MPDERGRLTPEEETSHARRGACLAIFVVPVLLCCACWILTNFTQGGKVYAAYYSLPLLYQGIQYTARMSCEADQQNPRPARYEETQERARRLYSNLVLGYNRRWQVLLDNKKDTSELE